MAKQSIKQAVSEATKAAKAKARKSAGKAIEKAKEAGDKAKAKAAEFVRTESGRRMVDQGETLIGGVASGVAEGWDFRIKKLPAGLVIGGVAMVAGVLTKQRDLQALALGGVAAGSSMLIAEKIRDMRKSNGSYKA